MAKIFSLKYTQIPLDEHPNWKQARNWPAGILRVLMFMISRLSVKGRVILGTLLGHILFRVARSRRNIVTKNIQACFPDLSARDQKALIRQAFLENVIGFMETAAAWWRPPEHFRDITEFHGTENLLNTLEQGHGVLLIGAHYTTLDMGGSLLSLVTPFKVTYRANNKPTMDWVIRKGREPFTEQQVERSQVRQIFKALRQGKVIWYAPDQDYGRDRSVFAPFFGVSAATVKATTKLASQPNTKTLFISHYRNEDDSGYSVYFSEPLENFPSGDETQDAKTINKRLEKEIRRVPEQYMWVHRRFKTRPMGEPNFYKKK